MYVILNDIIIRSKLKCVSLPIYYRLNYCKNNKFDELLTIYDIHIIKDYNKNFNFGYNYYIV